MLKHGRTQYLKSAYCTTIHPGKQSDLQWYGANPRTASSVIATAIDVP